MIKKIMYLATSINGRITIGENGTDWVTQDTIEDFGKLNSECGVVVMGKTTYKMFGTDFPQKNCLNIVMTKDGDLLKKEMEGALFTDNSPKEIIQLVEEKGYKKLFIVGGTKINTAFLSENLIDEIWINIHPNLIGNGKYLFDDFHNNPQRELKLMEFTKWDNGQVILKYEFK